MSMSAKEIIARRVARRQPLGRRDRPQRCGQLMPLPLQLLGQLRVIQHHPGKILQRPQPLRCSIGAGIDNSHQQQSLLPWTHPLAPLTARFPAFDDGEPNTFPIRINHWTRFSSLGKSVGKGTGVG